MPQSSDDDDDRRKSGRFSKDASSSLGEDHNCCRTMNHDGEDKLTGICLLNCCFKTGVDYGTYCLVDTLTKYDRKVSKNVAKMAKLMTP